MSLSVLTLNIWGLWLVSKKRGERVKHICDYLRTCTEDVVLLQEVWVDADAQLLIRAGRAAGLTHATHFRSGVFGSGLVTLSRHAIVRHGFWRYAAGGFATSIGCGDYYAGKGVGWVRLATPLGEVDVFNTHLHANYCHDYRQPDPALVRAAATATGSLGEERGDTAAAAAAAAALEAAGRGRLGVPPEAWLGSRVADDDDAGLRISQLLELSEVVRLASGDACSVGDAPVSNGGGRLVVLGGDLNCKPDTLEVDLLRMRLPGMKDAWAAAAAAAGGDSRHGPDGAGALPPNPEGYTCHAPGNTFQPRRQVPERIDYVWSNAHCSSAQLALQRVPGAQLSYSDHFAVRVTLQLPKPQAASPASNKSGPMRLLRSPSKQQQQLQDACSSSAGEGAAMPLQRCVATLMASQMLLEEGMRCFDASSSILSMVGGFLLASLAYGAVALPLLLPDVVLRGWLLTAGLAAAGLVAALGLLGLLMGQVADKSQRRALQSSYRLLRVWMQELGLDVPYTTNNSSSAPAVPGAGPQQ
ncbi:Endonuclease/exonuclease/phosphatase [Scenedesmus sp. NREL 46B-D3]|nr:Endonuclease/exonuclease/phosphatase [Scenedesmus sp. NREL 46B-D3]